MAVEPHPDTAGAAYIERVRTAHQRQPDGWCSCGFPSCGTRLLLDHLDQQQQLLRDAETALRNLSKATLVVETTLSTPYPDTPSTSPWERFVEIPTRRAYDAALKIRAYLNYDGPAPAIGSEVTV